MEEKSTAEGSVSPKGNVKIEAFHAAHGRAHVLAIGINDYDPSSGFHALKVCVNDAATVRDRFLDIEQLNADKSHCRALTSKSARPPSRGEILKSIRLFAEDADASDRLVLYFSGHGHRIGGEFYLVPQDAFASDDPTALVSLQDVLKALNASAAKLKLLIIDACLSGPDTKHLKSTVADLSPKFLKDYIEHTSGSAFLCSCGIDEESTTQSPNPKLSLFTHYLCEALGGHGEALESGLLTLASLYSYVSIQVRSRGKSYHHKQNPALSNTVQGLFLLGDFTAPLLQSSSLDLDQYPVRSLEFRDSEQAKVKDVLTEIFKWTAYSEQYLEGVVNEKLGDYFAETLPAVLAARPDHIGRRLQKHALVAAGLERFRQAASPLDGLWT